jgi:DNA repair exonuclease SbcCD nuclease subunit
MPRLRFVHAADLHLDSPFRGLRFVAPDIGQILQQATFQTYMNIIQLCMDEKVDALLVAGDIYDGADRSLQAQLRFYQGLGQLNDAGIASFICHGNHDPLNGWLAQLKRPPLSRQFRETVAAVPLDPGAPERATIYGFSYPRRDVTNNIARTFRHDPERGFAIGLLHANVGGDTDHANYAPCTIEDLTATDINYWALGHIHKHRVLQHQEPAVVYPGNPQGRHPNEIGERGVYYVEVHDNGQVTLQFRPLDVVRWEAVTLDISDMDSDQDLVDVLTQRLEDTLAAAERSVICRVRLIGRGPLHSTLQRDGYLESLRIALNSTGVQRFPFFWCERVIDATLAPLDREARRQAGDFLGTVLRSIDGLRENADGLTDIRKTMDDLFRSARFRKYFPEGYNDTELLNLLRDAEEHIVTALVDEP